MNHSSERSIDRSTDHDGSTVPVRKTRYKTLRTLRRWLAAQQEPSLLGMTKLWKGLFYCMIRCHHRQQHQQHGYRYLPRSLANCTYLHVIDRRYRSSSSWWCSFNRVQACGWQTSQSYSMRSPSNSRVCCMCCPTPRPRGPSSRASTAS